MTAVDHLIGPPEIVVGDLRVAAKVDDRARGDSAHGVGQPPVGVGGLRVEHRIGRSDLSVLFMKSDSVATPVEKFTISITGSDAKHGTLAMEWGPLRWTAPIVVLTPARSGAGT